jgi:3-deoxy-D-manno-octulosonate 8-phosphate phosphatase (KDO 8-P phosphatase)
MEDEASVQRRASRVKLLLMDCDGVLTDGRIWILESGDDQKAFNTRDGLGLNLLHRAGLRSGIISGRRSSAVESRAAALGIKFVRQGCQNKVEAFEEIIADAGVKGSEVAFIGDDLNDIPLMRRSELAVAVNDATAEAQRTAHFVTQTCGGKGAVRETVELILKAQHRWDEIIQGFLTQ